MPWSGNSGGGRARTHVDSAVAVADDKADGVGVGLAEVRAVAIDDGLGAVEDGVVSGDRPGGSIWRSAKTRPVAIAEAPAASYDAALKISNADPPGEHRSHEADKEEDCKEAVMPIGLPGRRTTSRRKLGTAARTSPRFYDCISLLLSGLWGLLAAGGWRRLRIGLV